MNARRAKHRAASPSIGPSRLATDDASPRDRLVLAALLLAVCLATAAAHWPVLSAQALCFDDEAFIVRNPLVCNPGWASVGRFFREVLEPSTVQGYYIPLAMTSLMVDTALGGRPDDLAPYHRTALTLHVLNTAFIIVLLYLLFHRPWPAALAGLLFGLHPLHVEPVAWVGERKTLLAAFFSLICLISYVRFAQSRGRFAYGLALAGYLLALLSKPTSTPLPLLLLLLDYWPLGGLTRRALVEKAPFFIICAASVTVTLISHARTASVGVAVTADAGLLRPLLLLGHNLGFYAAKLLHPTNLTPNYPPPLPLDLSNTAVLAGVIATAAAAAVVAATWRRTRALVVGSLFFVLAIAPTLGLVRYSWVNVSDKYVYLPIVGLLLPVAAALSRIEQAPAGFRRTRSVAAGAIVGLIAVAAGWQTRAGLANWRDTVTLYQHMLSITPADSRVHNNLAQELTARGRLPEALPHYQAALAAAPGDVRLRINLGAALARLGRYDEALAEYEKAAEDPVEAAVVQNNIADVLITLGRLEEAVPRLDAALARRPDYAEAHNNRGRVLLLQGRTDEARASFERAARLDPTLVEASVNLGAALARTGDHAQAVRHYEQALRLRPSFAEAHGNLALSLMALNRPTEAEAHLQTALRIRPDFADAYRHLGRLRAAQGRWPEAEACFREALRLNPRDAQAEAALREAAAHRPAAP